MPCTLDHIDSIPGMFLVVNRLNDISTMAGGCCGGGRGSVWVAMSAMVGLDVEAGYYFP